MLQCFRYFLILLFFAHIPVTAFGQDTDTLTWSSVLEIIHGKFSDIRHLSTTDLATWLDDPNRDPPVIFDTREKEEYTVSHLHHARHLDPGSKLKAQVQDLDKTTPIVVYCSVGYRSSVIARKLQKLGYSRVYNLDGSIFAWANEGRMVVKDGTPVKYVHPFDPKWGGLLKKEYRYTPDEKGENGGIPYGERIREYKRVAFIIGLLMFLLWESYRPFMNLFQKNLTERGRHGVKNVALGMLNAVAITLCFIMMWLWAAEWASRHEFGILNWLPLPPLGHALGAILLFDLFTYWFHRFSHEIAFFWRFHRVHHSDQKMDVTTANRFHVGEIILSSIVRIPVIVIFGATLWELLLYELIMFPIVQFHHANIGVSDRVDRVLRIFIVTPAMHKVHHSRIMPETNSNYTSLLSVWDRIFGSFRLRLDPHEISYGLDEFDHPQHQDLAGLLKTPLVNVSGKSSVSDEVKRD